MHANVCRDRLGKGKRKWIWDRDKEEKGHARGRNEQRTHIKDGDADKGNKRLQIT